MNHKGANHSATRLASARGTRHCSTVLGSATTGKQDSTQTWTSTELQQINVASARRNHACVCIQHATHPCKSQCKSKTADNGALFILTDQPITTSQIKLKEGRIKSAEN